LKLVKLESFPGRKKKREQFLSVRRVNSVKIEMREGYTEETSISVDIVKHLLRKRHIVEGQQPLFSIPRGKKK